MPEPPTLLVYWDKTVRGETVRYLPHRYEDGSYKLLQSTGDGSNRNERAIPARTLEEAVTLIEQGYCLRMSPEGGGAPVRVCPPKITVRRG